MIDTRELIDFSKMAARIRLDLQEKALKEKQATDHQFSAISFFMQKYSVGNNSYAFRVTCTNT